MKCPECKLTIDTIIERSGDDVLVRVGKCHNCKRYVIEKWCKTKCWLGDGNIQNPHTLLTMEGLEDVTNGIKT